MVVSFLDTPPLIGGSGERSAIAPPNPRILYFQ
jgi:hypothetical protein